MRLLYREAIYILLVWIFNTTGSVLERSFKESTQERTREIPHHQ